MNLPQLTAYIGGKIRKNQHPLDSLIQLPKLKLKEGEQAYNLFMTFDLDKDEILFESPFPYNEGHPKQFYYFGNNSGSNFQSYLVREVDSIRYLLSTVWSDLYLSLAQQQMGDRLLAKLIQELQKHSLVHIGEVKGEGKVNLSRIHSSLANDLNIALTNDKKEILVNGKKLTGEAFIRYLLGDDNRRHKYTLIIPKIRKDSEDIILSQHPEFLEFVMRINKITASQDEEEKKTKIISKARVCYICHSEKKDVSIESSTKFRPSGINKFFTTTTINSARYYDQGINYDDTYSFCSECYQDLLAGESFIEQRMIGRIARERTFMMPEGLMGPLNYEQIAEIKEKVDFAFQSSDAEAWLRSVEAEAAWMGQDHYVINFVVYRTDGKSVTLLDSFEDVPLSRFMLLQQLFAKLVHNLDSHLKGFSLGSIYRIIPVRETDKGQVDVGRVLSMYKAILSGHLIERETIYSYAAEALDKGMRQLSKKNIDNYKNLNLYSYIKKEDFYIKRIVMSFLVLMQALQELGIINKSFFKRFIREEDRMAEAGNNLGTMDSIEKMENFIEKQGFSNEAKALFFLGTLLNRVAVAQYQKEHKTKPILKKIQFQGMNIQEVLRLYHEIVEKLRQYNKVTLFSEHLMNRFHYYFGSIPQKWMLSDHANIFYIMAGYAYMVGNRAPDLSKEELELLEEQEFEQPGE
jgi:CRISPR-associated protein Csh1